MADPTLPGSIPGLLRRGSPVLVPVSRRVRAIGRLALVLGHGIDHDGVLVTADGPAVWEAPSDVHLDLSDPTGRAHAAWWAIPRHQRLIDTSNADTYARWRADAALLLDAAMGRDVDAAQLRDIALRLADLRREVPDAR